MSFTKRIIQIFLRECRRLKENHIYLFSMVIFPIFVTFFFTSLMNEGQPQDMPVGVVDLDNSATTRKLTRMLVVCRRRKAGVLVDLARELVLVYGRSWM